MRSAELLIDGFGRIQQGVDRVVTGLGTDELTFRIDPDANTIAWLIWHLTRVQDDHLADAFGSDQVWTSGDWSARFDLPFADDATGYGQSADEVAAVDVTAELLIGYHNAVHAMASAHLGQVTDADLDRIVDTAWNPPVTLGVRLISVIADGLQHLGQAAYVRGVVRRTQL